MVEAAVAKVTTAVAAKAKRVAKVTKAAKAAAWIALTSYMQVRLRVNRFN